MSKVEREIAKADIESWLDYKRVGQKKREAQEGYIETLIEAIEEGDLYLKEDKTFVQILKHPIQGELPVTQFEYQPRLRMMDIHSKLEGVKSQDADGRVLAYVSALTGKAKQIIKNLDSEDYGVAQAIAIFFL